MKQVKFTKIINQIRKSGMTQVQIADHLGISQQYVSIMANNDHIEPRYNLGVRIIQLRDERRANG